jgi:hypothetical protein
MNLLPKTRQKRNQLFVSLAVTLIAIGGIYFGVIRPQYIKLAGLRKQAVDMRGKLDANDRVIQQADSSAKQLASLASQLSTNEEDMATGDIYQWTLDTMRHFKIHYNKVDVPDIGQPSVGDMDLLPHFPYKQLTFNVRGTGYYHDIGKFIADFENKYPHMRVVGLQMAPANDGEKLSFNVNIVALVKSSL